MNSGARMILPNTANSFIVEELRDRLGQGLTVTIAFGGNSMLPMIDGRSDKVELSPIDGALQKGEIYLFIYQGHCVVHRLMRIDGDNLQFRGDNCINVERVNAGDVVAHLTAVVHADGSRVLCASDEWRRRSRIVARRRTFRNLPYKLFGRQQRRWERWLYFAALLILMWAPMGLLGVPLDNFVFGIRADHLLHSSVYIPAVFFMMDFFSVRRAKTLYSWLVSLILGMVTEIVQYLLPYRGFDINDLIANAFGVTLGAVILLIIKRKRNKSRI